MARLQQSTCLYLIYLFSGYNSAVGVQVCEYSLLTLYLFLTPCATICTLVRSCACFCPGAPFLYSASAFKLHEVYFLQYAGKKETLIQAELGIKPVITAKCTTSVVIVCCPTTGYRLTPYPVATVVVHLLGRLESWLDP